MIKRLFSFVIMATMLCNLPAFAVWDMTATMVGQQTSDDLTLIVELEGGGVLELRQSTARQLDEAAAVQSVAKLQAEAETALTSVTGTEVEGKITHIMSGIVIKGTYADIEKLEALPQVKAVYVSEVYSVVEPAMEMTAEIMGTGDYACAEQYETLGSSSVRSEYDGDGLVVGVIDSELWYTHPAFAAAPDTPALLYDDIAAVLDSENLVAEQMYTGLTAAELYKSAKIPFAFDYAGCDADPKTENTANYHGTHVAGIAVANNDKMMGVASNAQLVFAKVCADGASTMSLHTVVYALDDMVKIGVDVINMSIGTPSGFSNSRGIFDSIYEELESAGIAVAAAAGNDGRYGDALRTTAPLAEAPDYGLITEPATKEYSTVVASLSNSVTSDGLYDFALADGSVMKYYDSSKNYTYERFASVLGGKITEFEDCGLGTAADFAEISSLDGKVALITRGGASFSDSVGGAEKKGALAVIMVNTEDAYAGILADGCTIPCAVVKSSDGEILKALETKNISVEKKPYKMSTFSSRGAAPDLRLKPEITAVGHWVYSAAYNDGYTYLAGTSMATPQYAGAYASVLDYINKKINSSMSKSAKRVLATQLLASTAQVWAEDGGEDEIPASPRAQGAGVISLENAVNSPAVVINTYNAKTKVELGEISGTSVSFDFKVKNISDKSVTYNLSADVTTDGSKALTFEDGKTVNVADGVQRLETASVSFDCGKTLTVAAYSEKTVTATITLDSANLAELAEVFTNGFFVEGFVTLTNDSCPQLSIPFMGFYGDWSAIPILGGEDYGLENALSVKFTQDGATYKTAAYTDENGVGYFSPLIGALCFDVQNARNIKEFCFEVYNSEGTLVYKMVGSYLRRNMNAESSALIGGFDGKLGEATLSDGDYSILFTAAADCDDGAQNPQTVQLAVKMDSGVPKLEDAVVRTETIKGTSGRWLRVKMADDPDGAPQSSAFLDSEGAAVMPVYKDSSSGELLFNVTGYTLPSCRILIKDAAFNSAIWDITSADGYIGFYDSVTFKGLKTWDALVVNGLILNRYDPQTNSDGYTQKLFVWDDNLKPLAAPFVLQ